MSDRPGSQPPTVTRRRVRTRGGILARSLLLASLALGAALYWLAKDSPQVAADLRDYGLMTLAFVGVPILLAAASVAVLRLLRGPRR